jgi:hypothetical protein
VTICSAHAFLNEPYKGQIALDHVHNLRLRGSSRTLIELPSRVSSIDCKTGTSILSNCSGSLKACTSKLAVLPSGFNVNSWRKLTGPGGKGGADRTAGATWGGIGTPSRCLFAGSRPSIGSAGAGLLRLASSNTSSRMRCIRSRYCCMRPVKGPSGFLHEV